MNIKRSDIKAKALILRQKGKSIRDIEMRLKVPRSTLSGWLRDIPLTTKQKEKLFQNWRNALVVARKKAVLWHNEEKVKRLALAKVEARETLKKIKTNNIAILELALAMLYLGEGSKKAEETSMGNYDPLILKTFIAILKKVYEIDAARIRCELYLRADQNIQHMKIFWSKTLNIPIENFKNVNLDKRTANSKTYENYKGVCMVRYGNVAIKRKLLNISSLFCEKLIRI